MAIRFIRRNGRVIPINTDKKRSAAAEKRDVQKVIQHGEEKGKLYGAGAGAFLGGVGMILAPKKFSMAATMLGSGVGAVLGGMSGAAQGRISARNTLYRKGKGKYL